MTDLALQLGTHIFLHGTLVLLLAWGVVWWSEEIPAALTHVVWMTAFVVLLLLPVGRAVIPGWSIDLTLESSSSTSSLLARQQVWRSSPPQMRSLRGEMLDEGADDGANERIEATENADQKHWGTLLSYPLSRWLAPGFLLIWGAGLLLLSGRVAVGWLTLYIRCSSCRTMNREPLVRRLSSQLSIGPSVSVVRSSEVEIPTVWGIFSPIILLPNDATEWSTAKLQSVLLHELAHVKRWDVLSHILTRIARSIFWPNPLVWIAVSKATAAQERACDDVVLQSGVPSWSYAEQLLAFTKSVRRATSPGDAVALDAGRQFKSRIRALLHPSSSHRALTRSEIGLGIVAGLCLLSTVSAIQVGMTSSPDRGARYWLEAEEADPSTAFAVETDAQASNQSYVTATENGSIDQPPGNAAARYSFTTERSGPHVIWARVRVPSSDHNSLWLRVDSTRWIRWNGMEPGDRWHWVQVRDADQDQRPVAFDLTEGPHELELGPREDGIAVDQFMVTNNGSYRPRSKNAAATSRRDGQMIWLDAEEGAAEPPLSVERGVKSSGWRHLASEPGRDRLESPPINGRASYSFNVDRAGTYRLWGRVIAPSSGSNSLWVRMDGGSWIRWNDIRESQRWQWDEVHDADDDNAPVSFELSDGQHQVTIAYREGGVKLDRLLLTSEATYRPRGTGEQPDGAGSLSHSLPLSDAALTSPMGLHSDSQSVAPNGWIGVPDGPGNDVDDPGPGAAQWTVSLPESGEYVLLGEVLAPATNDNSFYVSVDRDREITWHTPAPEETTEQWTWDAVSHLSEDGHTDPVTFSLDDGRHRIHIRNREDGTRLRRLRLIRAPVPDSIFARP